MHTLIAPLDWGLGHAARSLALARQLQARGDRVSWACSGPAAEMLRRELPEGTRIHRLPSYRVHYRSTSMVWNVSRQLWHWQATIRAERRATARLVTELGPDRIVSDSRFGCYDPRVESVFLSHQLHPITHFAPASAAYAWQLRHFDAYWVPDHPGHDRLSGKLSSARGFDRVKYIGPLPHTAPAAGEQPYDLLALLSGPEPMRTRLEDILLPQLGATQLSVRLVRGLPAPDTPELRLDHTEVLPFADTPTLSRLLTAAEFVIARPGYSTLMDLRAMGKPAILIPTPGQTEQAYLAQRAQLQGWAVAVMDQSKLDLHAAVARVRTLR
ncbi:UDP-N-acetylglucosamine--N-acetylmuramyl-(pentapeptide) pyrophosphoryl-undecaprenol N-acetylglucosamine transferase [Neolewinella maritima]|uniref:UDP-N-acetylglucosamine--N-acetylmuramyl-(Pentapeptide) pyrophosphoryl-undecaprenol N-acetylglucosamine transferase n=1 Tax=Neolewinella maritima TaxID=1383882 RepID=A0ABM9B520_9BACT|nr:glycosyltransferase [Neolewinella maritima]CAH1002390.1 UDP-N-acetylglucosamine--N-acetylmuramyl-(pentapeptide) pyrophosphoryl-undecaprenol N-acetylglucosamine transferase [Neolewinella maritima]